MSYVCNVFLSFFARVDQVDITGGPKQIVAARHALAARVGEWKATNNPSNIAEEIEYSLKVR